MSQTADENKSALYNHLLESKFRYSNPNECMDDLTMFLGVNVPPQDVADKKFALEFEKQGLSQWMATNLVYFFDGIVFRVASDNEYGSVPVSEEISRFNTFIWKMAKSCSCRTKSWEVVEKNIKLQVLECMQNYIESGDNSAPDDVIENVHKAFKVCRQDAGFNGPLVDLMNYYLEGLTTPGEEVVLSDRHEHHSRFTATVSHVIIWAILGEVKDTLNKKLPAGLSCSLPLSCMLDGGIQEIFIAETRSK